MQLFFATLTVILSFVAISTSSPAPLRTTQDDGKLLYSRQQGRHFEYRHFTQDQDDRANAVIEMFRFAWNGYYTYAYPHDEYLPKNNSFVDSFNGWGVLMFDALDTAIIMEQTDIVNIILDYAPTVDFTKTSVPPSDSQVTSLFETNIRYLGGMMSAYDLLNGPFAHLKMDKKKVDALLTQAQSLADTLKFAFDTPTGIPVNDIFINNKTFNTDDQLGGGTYTAGLAELGTLCLEWQHLSDLTGDPSYGDLAQKAESYWFQGEEVWPGLTGSNFNVETGEILDEYGGWTSGNDSAYEYLIKMYVYDPERYENYSKRWQAAADSTITHLLSSPSSRPDLTMAGSFAGTKVQNDSQQLACFIGGNFILGSTVLDRQDYLKYGLDFCEFCANGYRSTASGIGPTEYSWNTSLLETNYLRNQSAFYQKAGWFIPDNGEFSNGQTPEALESWYYAYQVTGDQYWRDVAWAYALAQNRTARIESGKPGAGGFSDINDVFMRNGDGTMNDMESFMLAETLKYHYLIQTTKKGIWDVESGDDNTNYFVYNTEAHPLKVAAKKPV